MISEEEVFWLYRCLLGRKPESDRAIAESMKLYADFDTARQQIMQSREYANNNMASVFYRPMLHTHSAIRSRSKKLGLASIVKNEVGNIEFMLKSCLPIVDFVAIVDTGSDDATGEIARRMLLEEGVRHVVEQAAFETFSKSRNIALDLVPHDIDWVLMIDADEHLVPEDYWRLNALLEADVDAWQLPRYNFYDFNKEEAPKPYPDYQRRLFRNRSDKAIRFRGNVHEEPINVESWGFAPTSEAGAQGYIGGPHIHHMGQVGLTQTRWQEKHDFYTRLGRLDEPKT